MATLTLETLQNELIREVLNVNDINVLKKVKNLLRREERKLSDARASVKKRLLI